MRGKIPKVEYVFCDTGEELDETYNFIKELEKFLGQKIEWLQTGRNFKFYIELNHLFFYLLFGLLIGFYDGFFGPVLSVTLFYRIPPLFGLIIPPVESR